MDLHELDVRINNGGLAATGAYTAVIQSGLPLEVVRPILDALAGVGLSLTSIQQWSTSAAKAAPSLPNGMKVADVGSVEGAYTGPLDPDTLTKENWRYWQDHNDLHARTGQIFSKAPVIGIASTGYLYTPGDLANAVPDGTPFAGL
jgi:hypothetical protein